jgi:hypothetical protein
MGVVADRRTGSLFPESRNTRLADAPPLRRADRGSRAGRFRESRLPSVPPCRAADRRGRFEGRAERRREGSRSQREATMPGCGRKGERSFRSSGGGQARSGQSLIAVPHSGSRSRPDCRGLRKERRRTGDHLDAAPHSAWSGRIGIAKPVDTTRWRSTKCPSLRRPWKATDQAPD